MQIPIIGQSEEHWASDVNAQRTVNMYPSLAGEPAREQVVLSPTPGLTEMVDLGGIAIRALITFGSSLYAVRDDSVYKLTVDAVTRTATSTLIGTMTNTTGDVYWARNLTQVFIADGTDAAYILTPSTDTLAEVTDPDFLGSGAVVDLDGYFCYFVPGTQQMFVTAIEDGTSISALETASAESDQDNIVTLLVDKNELWVLGDRTVEIWYDAANPTGFPFSRREGAYIDQGCAAAKSAVNINNTMMWLDDRRYVVSVENYQINIVSTAQLNREFSEYSTVSDAVAIVNESNGRLFYVITFPTEGKTYAYDLTTGMWHERMYFNPVSYREEPHLAIARARFSNLEIVGDRQSGKVYAMASDVYTDNGDPIYRIRRTAHFADEFKLITVNSVEIRAETGLALQSGNGSDPYIQLRYSNNGGHTWSNTMSRSLGKVGEYNKPIRWNRLGTSREWTLEFKVVEPIKFTIIAGYADVEVENG